MNELFSVILLVVLCLVASSATPNQCSVETVGAAVYQCALDWWQREDLGQVVAVKYKLSVLVKNALSGKIDYDSMNAQLTGKIRADSGDPFAKIIESTLTVEPYLSFLIAEIIEGYDFTESELRRLNLPTDLAVKSNLIEMFTDYFDYSCTR